MTESSQMWLEFLKLLIPAGSTSFLLIPAKCDGSLRQQKLIAT